MADVLNVRIIDHAIIFGLSPYNDNDRQYIIDSWQNRCEDWQFDRIRGKKCAIQNVTPEDIEYVTGYVQKKLSGSMATETYGNKQAPFAIMSKGLGLTFAEKNKDRLKSNGFTYLNGHKISLPRYYRDKLGIEVDYTDIPTPTIENVMDRQNYLYELYSDYLVRNGLSENYSSVNDLNNNSKMFERWYDSHKWELANQVFKDFEQRSRMRNGL